MNVCLHPFLTLPDRLCHGFAALLLTGMGFLAGCATPPPVEPGPPGHWKGRFSLTLIDPSDKRSTTLEAHEERAQGRFTLTRSAQTLKLALFSPFGQTLANAVSGPDGAQLTTSDGRIFSAEDINSLMEMALGWKLPVADLADWLNGNSLGPGAEPVTVNNWQVRAEQRFDSGEPRRVAARWPARQRFNERRINLFLVVDRAS